MSYKSDLKKWKQREPKNVHSYEYEQWLEERPDPRHYPDGKARQKAVKQ
jgi:hypothetical protein